MVSDKAYRSVVQARQTVSIVNRQRVDESFCLLVEDDESCAKAVGALLKAHGFDFKVVQKTDDAISVVHENPGKVICAIVDLHLRNKEGEEVIQEIERFAPEIPTICHTGDAAAGEEIHEKYPRVNVVLKGASMSDLLSALGFRYAG